MSSLTQAIASNPAWNASTPASEVATALSPSIAGKTILVTGVLPGGLGAYFAKVVAAHRPRLLILVDRGGPPLAAYAAELRAAHPEVAVRTLEVDLGSFAHVRRAAAELLAWPELEGSGGGIDVLVTNAGVMSPTYQTTADGLELHFGVNYVGHFLFVNLVMPKLLESKAGARVVNVSSNGHRSSDIRWDDLNFQVCPALPSPESLSLLRCPLGWELGLVPHMLTAYLADSGSISISNSNSYTQDGKAYHMWRAYGQSKTALILFSVELARRLGPKGLKAFSLHPGSIWTNLSRSNSDEDWARLSEYFRACFAFVFLPVLANADRCCTGRGAR